MVSQITNPELLTLYESFSDKPFVQAIPSLPPVDWEPASVYATRLHTPPGPQVWTPDRLTVIFHVSGIIKIKRSFEGRINQGLAFPGVFDVAPKGLPASFEWIGPLVQACVFLNDDRLEVLAHEVSPRDPARVEFVDRFNMTDPLVAQICYALVREVETAGLGGAVYVDALTQVLALHLLRGYSTLTRQRLPPGRKLTTAQMHRIEEYIHTHYQEPITLPELAACINFSPSHFARLFKETTGLAPHQYLIHYRVGRARELLLEGGAAVADVARQVGFTDQSHLTHHFKRLLGLTPNAALRESKNVQNHSMNHQDDG